MIVPAQVNIVSPEYTLIYTNDLRDDILQFAEHELILGARDRNLSVLEDLYLIYRARMHD